MQLYHGLFGGVVATVLQYKRFFHNSHNLEAVGLTDGYQVLTYDQRFVDIESKTQVQDQFRYLQREEVEAGDMSFDSEDF